VTKVIDPARLVRVEPTLPRNSISRWLDHASTTPRVGELARPWGAGRERGWLQIEQVILRLRGHVTLDPGATVDPSKEPVNELLFGSRRGPSYQIASAAVMLLRSLDYTTRLVSGLYADESNVDSRSGYAALRSSDTHFWIEVRLADGTWVTVDPSPGYPLLNLPRPPTEMLTQWWTDATGAVVRHRWPLMAAAGLATLVWVSRKRLIDGGMTIYCRCRGCEPVIVLRAIELRSRLVGKPRPPGLPPARWLMSLESDAVVEMYARGLNHALYNPNAGRSQHNSQAARVALTRLTRRRIARLNAAP
jgi:hypothetical protein